MRAYKGFNQDMTCRGFQYAEGETYETDSAVLCKAGFHACPMPLDTWQYYQPSKSVYHEVEVPDDAVNGGDKVAATSIKIGGRLSLPELIGEHIKLVFERVKRASGDKYTAATSGFGSTAATSGYQSTAAASGIGSTAATSGSRSTAATSSDRSTAATSGFGSTAATSGSRSTAATSGYQSTAAASGDWSIAATSGFGSTAATSGNQSTAATSGNWSTAATSGYESTASVTGEGSVAVATGVEGKARGALGCWLVLTERADHSDDYHIREVRAVRVDGDTIKPDVAYTLRNGRVVEV